ncbi:MAG: DUF4364 family protein [Clostridia bacterium]|nr:DUF4364 family protein [Clostridia bacterium]
MSGYFFNNSVDLKLIILFIVQNFKRPVTISDIYDIITSRGYAEYFEMAESFSELEESELITPASRKGTFIITDKGIASVKLLGAEIPFTIKEALMASIKTAKKKENEAHSIVSEYKETLSGEYEVFCEINEAGFSLFSMSVTLPTKESAAKATASFRKNAEIIYTDIIKKLS